MARGYEETYATNLAKAIMQNDNMSLHFFLLRQKITELKYYMYLCMYQQHYSSTGKIKMITFSPNLLPAWS